MAETPHWPACKKRPANAESRAWVRYPCDTVIAFQPIDARKDGTWHSATIKNISAKGLGLNLDMAVQRGAILSVKLEGVSQRLSQPLLVRVVRVADQASGGCHVGCTFAIPLGEEELRALLHSGEALPLGPEQGQAIPPGEGADRLAETYASIRREGERDRRVFPRQRISIPVTLAYGSDQEITQEAVAIDASRGGLRLLTAYSFGRGTLLRVRSSKAPRGAPFVPVRVRSCTSQQMKWVTGVQFLEPPSPEVLRYFS